MMNKAQVLYAALLVAPGCFAQSEPIQPTAAASASVAASSPLTQVAVESSQGDSGQGWQGMCLLGGKPPAASKYHVVGKLRLAKGTYGSARVLVPQLVNQARAEGADALMDYSGAQRFGFWPWRLTRPVVSGTAIKWDEAPVKDCREMGGVTAGLLVQTNESPPR